MIQTKKKLRARPARSLHGRWHADLQGTGFTPVSNVFLNCYSALQPPISAGEALFIIHLMSFKWDASDPYPAYKTVAKCMGVSDKTARRHAVSLERKGYLSRSVRENKPNLFKLDKLMVKIVIANKGNKLNKDN